MSKTLVKKLEAQITESESGAYDVGEQRERNHRYYTMQPMGNEVRGRSHYVDPAVLDAVESKKALFSETFLSNRQTVKFKQGGNQTPRESDAKTAYAMQTLRRNKHEEMFRDGWHDAFVAKRMVIMAYWHEATDEVTIDFQNAHPQQVMQMVSRHGQVLDMDQSQMQQTPQGLSGSLTLTVDDSHVALELIQPERYFRDPLASYPEEAQWNAVEKDVPRGTLILDGYDPEQVRSLSTDYRFRSEEEDSARKAHDKSWTRRQQYDRDENQSHVTVYRTWTWCNLNEDGYEDQQLDFEPVDEIRLYEIHWAHGEILKWSNGIAAISEVDGCNFFEWSEMKVSHAEFGLCTADIMAHHQKTQSTLKRLVIDNQQMRNNTRYEAAIGALKNPRDLVDNKIGAVVWSRKVGSVAALPTPELSPLTFNVLEMLQRDGERRDGYSALGKGMNNDAVRYQNAESMVERLTTAGTRRPMRAARDWAQTFLIPLCQHIVKLGMDNDRTQTQLEVGGRIISIAPQSWSDEELAMDVCVALTPEEGKAHAQQLMMLHSVMSQDPELQQLYGVAQKHALMDDVFDALGVSDTTPYMMRPDSEEYKVASQKREQMVQEEKQKQDYLLNTQVKLSQSSDRRAWEAFEWSKTTDMDAANRDSEKVDHEIAQDEDEFTLKLKEFRHDAWVDKEELEIERNQERAASIG